MPEQQRPLEAIEIVELSEILDLTADWLWHGPIEGFDLQELVVELRRWAIRVLNA